MPRDPKFRRHDLARFLNRDPLGKDPILDQPDNPVLGVLIKFLWHTPDFPIYSNGRKPGPFHTPTKKPAGPPQTETNKIYNRAIGKIRWRIEQTIAHLKNWHALKTRYRRPINTFPDTITAILGIIFTYTL